MKSQLFAVICNNIHKFTKSQSVIKLMAFKPSLAESASSMQTNHAESVSSMALKEFVIVAKRWPWGKQTDVKDIPN